MATSLPNKQKVRLHYAVSRDHRHDFPIKGQGTVSVSLASFDKEVRIVLSTAGDDCVGLTIDADGVALWTRSGGVVAVLDTRNGRGLGLDPANPALPYWMSLDTSNGRIRYGKGEMQRDLMLYEFSWAEKRTALPGFGKDVRHIRIEGAPVDHLRILDMPVTLTPSPHLIASSAMTLETIAENSASVIDDLPPECRVLYANVAGPGMNLAPPDFPEFAQAIQYSIVTPGRLCHEKLREKDPAFGYLRVTLDANMGDSPGQPYVLEIWPAGNGSPIHDHGNACAVIKVLHGQIQVSWFSALSPHISEPWGSTIAHAGEVTFLTPGYYQIHKLFNPSPKQGGSFCATIQCYRYLDRDVQHYEYFDYLEDDKVKQFSPDSDWRYLDFKHAIRDEWDRAGSGHGG
jgi:hypothetical protein